MKKFAILEVMQHPKDTAIDTAIDTAEELRYVAVRAKDTIISIVSVIDAKAGMRDDMRNTLDDMRDDMRDDMEIRMHMII